MVDRWLDWFASIDPQVRRKWALGLLVASFVLGHVNIAAYLGGLISHEAMDTITNYLSWLAITFTCLDVLVTTDVRAVQEEETAGG